MSCDDLGIRKLRETTPGGRDVVSLFLCLFKKFLQNITRSRPGLALSAGAFGVRSVCHARHAYSCVIRTI